MEAMNGKLVRIGSLELRFLVDETHGAGELVMFEFAVPPGARVPAPHFHECVDEAVYGLAGIITTTVDGREREVRRGESVFIPRGSVHHHANRHDEPARALVVMTPGAIGRRYFEEMAAETNAPGGADPTRVRAIMLNYGLVPA